MNKWIFNSLEIMHTEVVQLNCFSYQNCFFSSDPYNHIQSLADVMLILLFSIAHRQQAVLTCTRLPFLSFDLLPWLCQKILPLFITVRNCALDLWEGSIDSLSYFLPGLSFSLCRDPSAAFPSDYGFFVLDKLSEKKALLLCPVGPSPPARHPINKFLRHFLKETH